MSIADHQPKANPSVGGLGVRSLYVAWRPSDASKGWRPVGRLDFCEPVYRFQYTKGAKFGFHPFPGMSDLHATYTSVELFPIFANRLLSKSRPEYVEFLRWGAFEGNAQPDPLSILGVTEGLRQTDAIEVFPWPHPDASGCFSNKFFLHGIRWLPKSSLDRIAMLESGEPLKLMLDVQNGDDPQAVGLRTEVDRTLIGYFPRYLAQDVWQLLHRCDVSFMHVTVNRVNATAPLQNRVLCQMRACWPEGFRPCSTEEFQPLSETILAKSSFGNPFP